AEGIALAAGRGLRRLARGSVSEMPFAPGSFDVITSIDVLCHRGVAKEDAPARARRCPPPGGVLVPPGPAVDRPRGEHDDAVWTDRRFSRPEIRGMLERAGFAVLESFYRVSLLFPAAAARRLLAARRTGAAARSEVRPPSSWANAVLGSVMSAEAFLASAGLRLPFGLSVFSVARRIER